MKSPRRRRLAFALAGSLLLHAGGLVVFQLALRRSRVRPPAAAREHARGLLEEGTLGVPRPWLRARLLAGCYYPLKKAATSRRKLEAVY